MSAITTQENVQNQPIDSSPYNRPTTFSGTNLQNGTSTENISCYQRFPNMRSSAGSEYIFLRLSMKFTIYALRFILALFEWIKFGLEHMASGYNSSLVYRQLDLLQYWSLLIRVILLVHFC